MIPNQRNCFKKTRKYRNDDRHSDSSSNERVALAFLKVIFNISVWFMDDYNNEIIHNSDFDTNILTQIEKESQVSKEDVGKIVNDAVNLAMIQSSEDKANFKKELLNISKKYDSSRKNLEDKIDNLIMEYSNADLIKFVTDNYAPKDEIYKIVSNEIENLKKNQMRINLI